MSRTPLRRWLLAGGGWLLTVVVATAVATGAAGSLGQGIFGASDDPLTAAEVEKQLAAGSTQPSVPPAQTTPAPDGSAGTPPGTAAPSGGSPASPGGSAAPSGNSSATSGAPSGGSSDAAAGTVRALTTTGGTILASCAGGLATLRSWTPNAGFEADHVSRGPATVASLRFKARSGGGDIRAQITCDAGEPRLATTDDD